MHAHKHAIGAVTRASARDLVPIWVICRLATNSLHNTVYVYVCVQTNVCVPLYSAKGIDDVALNKK